MEATTQEHTPVRWTGPSTFIDGRWREGGETVVYDKYTGEALGAIREATAAEVDLAVAAAERSFRQHQLSPFERYEILHRFSEWVKAREAEIIRLLIAEVGKTYQDTKIEVTRAYQACLLSAEEAKRIGGEVLPVSSIPGAEGKMGFAMRVPKGVIGAITPFNYPFLLAMHKIAPAIAAGNTIVIKPAPNTPFSTALLVEGLQACGLPQDHVQLVQGGAETGNALLHHPGIRMYTFTGSAAVGERVKTETGLRPVLLELGNTSPNIVCADADLDRAALLCGQRAFTAAGQACISVQRILVERACWDEFVPRLLQVVEQLKVGDPRDPETNVGPMISEREAMRAMAWIDEAVQAGARVLCGHRREGAFVYPTLLTDVDPRLRVYCQEVFAPVAVLVPFDTLDEAIALANGTPYGLHAAIFTRSLEKAMKAWRELEFGGVIVNDTSTFRSDLAPYGGVKASGLGKEGPRYAIEEMTDLRVMIVDLT
ncbi:aldehyde dehydrogenase family protein [Alicyclobacillus macrosporangiidus]|uniref:aldehyde dehydrogenase family protein n=1 Tax=Alicyclobacillus macrosporangiidus TaxID=392015 RepID=UPI00069224E6|nr:aldehyde dehydrogenase family protein [Alicyclobacillus macrosporangiidus]